MSLLQTPGLYSAIVHLFASLSTKWFKIFVMSVLAYTWSISISCFPRYTFAGEKKVSISMY